MDTIFMNSENSKTFDLHRLLLNLLDKINWGRSDKFLTLLNRIYWTCKSIKKSCENNIFEISASTWNEKFELPDESYSDSAFRDWIHLKKT